MTRRILAVLLLAPLAAGCSLLPSPGPARRVNYYSLEPTFPARRQGPPPDLILAVQPLSSASRYEERILHRGPDGSVGYHEYDRWVERPAEMLTQALLRSLQEAAVTRAVVDGRLVRRPDLVLDGRVTRFDQFRRGGADGPWLALCELELVLKQEKDGRILLTVTVNGKFELEKVDGAEPTHAAFAPVMNVAVSQMLAHAADAIAKILPTSG